MDNGQAQLTPDPKVVTSPQIPQQPSKSFSNNSTYTSSTSIDIGSPLLMAPDSGTGKAVTTINSNSNVISRDGGEDDSIDDKNTTAAAAAEIVNPENTNPTPPAEPEPDVIYCDYVLELLKRKKDLDARERCVHELELEYRDVITMAKQLVDLGVEADQIIILQEAVMYVSEIEEIDTTEAAQKIFGMLKRTIDVGKVVSYAYR